MNTQLITGIVGNESHSSSWGKFQIRGIELVPERRINGRHELYTVGAVEVADGVMFTVWSSEGDKRGADTSDFYILITDASADEITIRGGHVRSEAHLTGRWRVLAEAHGTTYAPRLLSWWINWAPTHGGQTAAVAQHLGEQIARRGVREPAPMPTTAAA